MFVSGSSPYSYFDKFNFIYVYAIYCVYMLYILNALISHYTYVISFRNDFCDVTCR